MERSIKLGLLPLVLALVLFWYSVNPAPLTAARRESKDNQPEAKKRPTELQARRGAPPPLQFHRLTGPETSKALPSSVEEPDDFEWPEFIDG